MMVKDGRRNSLFFMGTVMGGYLDDPVQKALGRKHFLSLFSHECAAGEGARCGGA